MAAATLSSCAANIAICWSHGCVKGLFNGCTKRFEPNGHAIMGLEVVSTTPPEPGSTPRGLVFPDEKGRWWRVEKRRIVEINLHEPFKLWSTHGGNHVLLPKNVEFISLSKRDENSSSYLDGRNNASRALNRSNGATTCSCGDAFSWRNLSQRFSRRTTSSKDFSSGETCLEMHYEVGTGYARIQDSVAAAHSQDPPHVTGIYWGIIDTTYEELVAGQCHDQSASNLTEQVDDSTGMVGQSAATSCGNHGPNAMIRKGGAQLSQSILSVSGAEREAAMHLNLKAKEDNAGDWQIIHISVGGTYTSPTASEDLVAPSSVSHTPTRGALVSRDDLRDWVQKSARGPRPWEACTPFSSAPPSSHGSSGGSSSRPPQVPPLKLPAQETPSSCDSPRSDQELSKASI